ncbi:MAG: hypothetical protein ACTSQI_15150 [Candidatus Helarchaeota archaeon]
MIDWLVFWDQMMAWIQILTGGAVMALLGIAGLAYILRSRKIAIDAAIIAVILVLVATVLAKYGIEILPHDVYDFFGGIFN